MELNQKKYKREQVEKIVLDIKNENQTIIANYKQKIIDLALENQKLKAEIEDFREKESSISSAIRDAENFSATLKENAEKKYLSEIECLKSFAVRWREYFNSLKEKYPLYGKIDEAKNVFDEINSVILKNSGVKAIDKINDKLDDFGVNKTPNIFNPQGVINDYISATSDNGFNLNDVLNPGELELGELCKELGLIDEEV